MANRGQPHQRGRLRALGPLLLSLALSAGLAGWLAGRTGGARAPLPIAWAPLPLQLLEPRALLLVGLLPLLTVGVRLSLVDGTRAQQGRSLVSRALLLLVLVGALSHPVTLSQRSVVCRVLLVDVSDSISDEQLAAAQRLVDNARHLRSGEQLLRLVTFAQDARVEALPVDGAPLPPLSTWRHPGHGSASDLAGALRFALALAPPGTLPRATLVSDGLETTDSAVVAAAEAARAGLLVDSVPLPRSPEDEVLIRSLELPADVRRGQPFEVQAELWSSVAQPVTLTLYREGQLNPGDARRALDLPVGSTRVRFRAAIDEPGFSSFKLLLGGKLRDRFAANNEATAAVAVRGRPRVLYIEGEPASATYLSTALQREGLEVESRSAYGLPQSARELGRFELVILSDVPAMSVGAGQLAALESYVRDQGGGLLVAGGQNSFGSGGWTGTRLEQLLPVRFETEKRREQPQLALELLIDKSGSMAGLKMELAKDAAAQTAQLLGGDDLLGVIGFDGAPVKVVPLQRAANRTGIQQQIARITASGGTNILLPLKQALDDLVPAVARVKHVILLTDGQASYEGIPQLVDELARQKITVSAVGVGPEADRTLLAMIAERGGGRFHHTLDPQNVPRIFTRETSEVARAALVEQSVGLRIEQGAELFRGIPLDRAPPLRGYVSTRLKPLGELLLSTTQGEPLLARWRVGLGQVVAFTSDVKNRWAVDWLRWPGYGPLFGQLCRSTLRQQLGSTATLPGASFELRTEVRPPLATVQLDARTADDRYLSGQSATLTVLDPADPDHPLERPLFPTAPGRYEAELSLGRVGTYNLKATLVGDDGRPLGEATASLSLPYAREYLALPPDEGLLERVALAGGGRPRATPADLFDARGASVEATRPLWPPLVWAAALLLLLDVLLRRLTRPERRT